MVSVKIGNGELRETVHSLLSLSGIPVCDGENVLICDDPRIAESASSVIVLYKSSGYLRSAAHKSLVANPEIRYVPLPYPFEYSGFYDAVRQLILSEDSSARSTSHALEISDDGSVSYNGMTARLSGRETALFTCLYSHAGKPVSREKLRETVWGNETEEGTNVVDVYVSYLRRKLAPIFGKGVIVSERGLGYTLILPRE